MAPDIVSERILRLLTRNRPESYALSVPMPDRSNTPWAVGLANLHMGKSVNPRHQKSPKRYTLVSDLEFQQPEAKSSKKPLVRSKIHKKNIGEKIDL